MNERRTPLLASRSSERPTKWWCVLGEGFLRLYKFYGHTHEKKWVDMSKVVMIQVRKQPVESNSRRKPMGWKEEEVKMSTFVMIEQDPLSGVRQRWHFEFTNQKQVANWPPLSHINQYMEIKQHERGPGFPVILEIGQRY